MDVVDEDGVAFKLHFVVIPSRAFHVTATVRIRVMCQFYAVRRALEGSFGLDQLSLRVRDGLVGVG